MQIIDFNQLRQDYILQYLGIGIYFPNFYHPKDTFIGLHIHLIRDDKTFLDLHKIEENLLSYSRDQQKSPENIMFQWGTPSQLKNKNRFPLVSSSIINDYGDFGIGSYATGGKESEGKFIGGGEAIQIDKHNFRIRKGDLKALKISRNINYPKLWIMQTAKFNSNCLEVKNMLKINSRSDFISQIKKIIGEDTPFIIFFRCFPLSRKKNMLRSNGFLPEEVNQIININNSRLPLSRYSHPEGGHFLDKEDSMKEELEPMSLAIYNLFIQPIEKLLISKGEEYLHDFRVAKIKI